MPLYFPQQRGFVVLGASNTAASISTGTSEVILATVTIPAGLLGPNGTLWCTSLWSWTNSANNKTPRIRLGGIGGTIYMATNNTTTVVGQDQTIIRNNNSQSSQKGWASNHLVAGIFGTSATAMVTSSVDTSAETTLVFTGQPASAGETVTLESYLVEYLYGA